MEIMHPKEILDEGINGLGQGVVNTNSPSFTLLREKIVQESRKRDPVERIKDRLLGIRLQMEYFVQEKELSSSLPVGEFLKSSVQILGIKHKSFAAYLDLDESNLSAVYRGRRKINLDLAMKLGKILNIPPHLWLNVQNKNELHELALQHPGRYEDLGLIDLINRAG